MGLRKKEDGSIAVEASLIMPIFLCFIIFLVTMIRISIVEISLNSTVSEATKQISTHMYPIDVLFDAENKANDYASFFPPEVRELIGIYDSFEGVVDVYDSVLGRTFQPIVDHYVDDQIIRLEHLQVTKVTLPNLRDRDQTYFGLTVRYDMPLHIPFINKVITFKQQAYERVWIGAPEKAEELYIDSISSPVQRGKKVRIMAKGPPDQEAAIRLTYESGFQKEQNCRFSSDGWLLCDIKIGGNANEGIYQAIVTVDDQVARGTFEVMSKESIKQYTSNRKKPIKKRK